ncbi:MAG: hypothetical protein ACI9OJ_004331 [Myxococcota bacterium]|jgi:hypothetical protein
MRLCAGPTPRKESHVRISGLFLVTSLALIASSVASAQSPPPDAAKAVVEVPIKTNLQPPGPMAVPVPTLGETVLPGKVNWHADLGTAQRVSRASGKPILLFQLLGDLDTRFS